MQSFKIVRIFFRLLRFILSRFCDFVRVFCVACKPSQVSVVVVAIHLASAHPSAALLPLDTSQARPQRLDSVARAQNMCEECCTAIVRRRAVPNARCCVAFADP